MSILQPIAILVGVVSGVAGLVLGILNYRHQRDTSRPRIRVRPRLVNIIETSAPVGHREVEEDVGLMEICNIGAISVFGSSIGFQPKRRSKEGLIVVSPQPLDNGSWPREIQPQHSVALRMKIDRLLEAAMNNTLGKAFASSVVGDVFTATRRDMRDFRKNLLAAARSSATKNQAG